MAPQAEAPDPSPPPLHALALPVPADLAPLLKRIEALEGQMQALDHYCAGLERRVAELEAKPAAEAGLTRDLR